MKIILKEIGNRYIELSIPIGSTLQELKEWEQVQYLVLLYAYNKQSVHLVTLSPQKYSLGYELVNPTKIKLGKKTLLVNYIDSCSEDIIQEIVESEEFKRGLLRLITIDPNRLKDVIGNVFFQFMGDSDIDKTDIDYQLITCEDDGKTLSWFNPRFPMKEVEAKLREVIEMRV